jgi:hypothetical protein
MFWYLEYCIATLYCHVAHYLKATRPNHLDISHTLSAAPMHSRAAREHVPHLQAQRKIRSFHTRAQAQQNPNTRSE